MKMTLCLFVLTVMVGEVSYAQSGRCYSIRSSDFKYECLATVNKSPLQCYSIKDSDRKNSCLALVKNQKNSCYSIKDRDKKTRCLASFN